MENTGYVGLSYEIALQRKMDQIANNIANIDTSGYKSGHNLFNEYVLKAQGQKPISMVSDYGTYKNFAPGALQQTGNTLDVAIEGNGFFAVTTPEGEKYTRNGNLKLDGAGQIVTSFNMPVADAGGAALIVPAGAKDITIAEDGTISTDQGQLGKLKLVRFDNPQELRAVGNSLFETDQQGVPDPASKIYQGMIEGSNVNAVTEMTDMIEVMRKYQSVARLLQDNHDGELGMIQKLSRL